MKRKKKQKKILKNEEQEKKINIARNLILCEFSFVFLQENIAIDAIFLKEIVPVLVCTTNCKQCKKETSFKISLKFIFSFF